ncbi:MAG: hypothetical protein HUU57_08445 [Bdellovibrio sp.]|nr:hypothetical protein [Bdellovibrio sp.]
MKSTSFSSSEVKRLQKDLKTLFAVPVSKKLSKDFLPEYPFDAQLLSLSALYRRSRKSYLQLGGTFSPRVCSTMRSLSAQDLFKDQIDYSPIFSELTWFKDHSHEVADPGGMVKAFSFYNEISIYHEQNHRILWRLLPPAPTEAVDFCRYLDFAESLVVTLDLALGDELGKNLSPVFEAVKAIYRPGGDDNWFAKSKSEYRQYLHGLMFTTYLVLQLAEPADIPDAVAYVIDAPKKMNKDAVRRGQELSDLFTLNTNQQWQRLYWKTTQQRLAQLHRDSDEEPFYVSEDPLDFEEEFVIANRVFAFFDL